MTGEPLELAGLLIACGATAAALLAPGARWQPVALTVALVVAPVLVLGDVWDEPRVADARESPGVVAAGVAAIAAGVVVGAVVMRRWPWALPALAFATLALRLPVRIGGETSNLLIPLYLVIASGVSAALWERLPPRPGGEPPAVIWLRRALAATLVLYAVQASYSEDVSNAIENAGFFLVPFGILFCLLAEARWDRRTLVGVGIVVGLVGTVLAAMAIGQFVARDLFFNKDLLDSNQIKPFFRVNSLFHDPNVLGRYLALGVIGMGAAIAWSRGGRTALAATAAGALMLAGLALTYSITSIAAMLAGLAILAILRYGLRGGLAAAVAILLTGAVFVVTGGADRSDIGPARGIDDETSGRVGLLEGGWDLIKDEPVTGWGSGAFGRAYFNHIRQTETTASHSEPITVAAEQGAAGALLFLVLLAAMAWLLFGRGVRASAGRAAAAAGIAALVVHSLGYAGFLTDPATWALLALAVALRRPGKHPPRAPDSSPAAAT